MGHVTIGQIAKKTGMAAKTIRYYEQIGVLPVPGRTASGYRQYDESAAERLHFISRARSLGLPLRRLRMLTSTFNGAPRAERRPQLLALVQEQLAAVQHRIVELEALRQQLEQVSRRMLTVTPQQHTGACRCLETTQPTEGSARRAPRQHQRSSGDP
jgi:MerR family copper efflux transcriptional regulator